MKTTIKEYNSEDLDAVVALNRSITAEWNHYEYIDGEFIKGSKANPEELSNFEQWWHGGPWNNPDIFPVYVQIVEKCNGKIFLAWDEENNLVGEIDCCEANNYGNSGYILWILTHLDHRQKGIGQKLILRVNDFFKEKKFRRAIVMAENEVAALFYKKIGFHSYQKRINLEFTDPVTIPWKYKLKFYKLATVSSKDLGKFDLFNLYPLIGSTESNNYVIQTASHRNLFVRLLGDLFEKANFLSQLWIYRKEDKTAIFSNVYQMRAWVNQNGLNNEEFLMNLFIILKSLHNLHTDKKTLQVSILDKDLSKFDYCNYEILGKEDIFTLELK